MNRLELSWRELDKALFSIRSGVNSHGQGQNPCWKNFGDNIDRWIYYYFTGQLLPDRVFLIAGSVLKRAEGRIVWGAGFGSALDRCGPPKELHAVRGKLSRQRLWELGHQCPTTYGDPGLVLPLVYMPEMGTAWGKEYDTGFIPHKRDTREFPWALTIHPERNHPKDYIRKLLSCRMIASSSLHGCVVSDAYEVPNVWVGFEDRKKEKSSLFKWKDYYSAVDLDMDPVSMTEPEIRKRATVHPKPDLKRFLEARPF